MRYLRYSLFLVTLFHSIPAYSDISSDLSNIEKEHCPLILNPETCPSGFPALCPEISAGNQSVIEQVKSHCEALPDPKADSVLQIFLDGIRPYYPEIAGFVIAGLLAGLALLKAKLERVRESAKIAFSRLADPFLSEKLEYESRALNVVLVGEGGSGKTTLIHGLTAAPEAIPSIATDKIASYSLVQEMTVEINKEKKRRLFRIFIDDYVGQRFVDALKDKNINRRLENIQASLLVIVVDLFRFDRARQDELRSSIELKRVEKQLSVYNEQVIQLLLDRTSSSRHIVLFINKIDMISPLTPKVFQAAIDAYAPLIGTLDEVRGRRLHVIVGSAQAGIGVVGYHGGRDDQKSLLQLMHDASKPFQEVEI